MTDGNFTYSAATGDTCDIDTFDYNITDGKGGISNTATITIDVQNILIAVNDYFVSGIGQTNTYDVLENEDNITYSIPSSSQQVTSVEGVPITITSDGSFTYTPPTATFSGQDSFDYNITDGGCSIATATATITVTDMCDNAVDITTQLCTGDININVEAGTPEAYYFTLPAEAILEVNISNTGQKELQYDFQEANCGKLFTSGTTSYLPQGDGINIIKVYPAATYFLGYNVGQVQTDVSFSICYDTNLSGYKDDYVNSNIGVNNHGVNYNDDKNITTKIVLKPFGLRASYLDSETGQTKIYDGLFGKKAVDMAVVLSLATDSCEKIEVISDLILKHGEDHIDTEIDNAGIHEIAINKAIPASRIKMTSFDYGALFRAATGLNCAVSSLDSSLCLVPACFNNSDNIRAVFPPAFYPHVNLCINGDGGGAAPCDSNAYSGNCGGKKTTISPAEYNHDLGCAACLADAFPGAPCSIDNFAIRPKAYDVNISNGDTFIAGKTTNLKFEATDWNDNTPTINYNEHEDNSFAVDINFTDLTKNCPVDIELKDSVHFANGIDTNNFYFNDIGKDLNFTIHEINGSEYAIVDADDTNDTDRLITPFLAENIEIIPDHFNIEANLTDHNIDNDFTYLHDINLYDSNDNYSMASTLTIDIKAEGENNETTSNYIETCYAQDTDLTLVLDDTNITYPGSIPALTKFLYYNPIEDDGSANSGEGEHNFTTPITSPIIIASLPIKNIATSFPDDAPDGNGTTHIEYKLNFDRKQHLVVNPFKIELSDVNITDADNVKGSAIETAGILSLDQNATMYYARTHASKFFYDDITESSTKTPIIINIYCNPVYVQCEDWDINTTTAQTNEYEWWLSLGHDMSKGDGNIELVVGNITPSGSATVTTAPSVNIISNAKDENVEVSAASSTPRPMTVEIDFVTNDSAAYHTNTWLIYNPDKDEVPSPFYKVRFIGQAGWAGHGDTGNVVGGASNIEKNRRLEW